MIAKKVQLFRLLVQDFREVAGPRLLVEESVNPAVFSLPTITHAKLAFTDGNPSKAALAYSLFIFNIHNPPSAYNQ